MLAASYEAKRMGVRTAMRGRDVRALCPDAVFVEDTVVVYGDLAVISRPGADERKPETAGAERTLRELGHRERVCLTAGHWAPDAAQSAAHRRTTVAAGGSPRPS